MDFGVNLRGFRLVVLKFKGVPTFNIAFFFFFFLNIWVSDITVIIFKIVESKWCLQYIKHITLFFLKNKYSYSYQTFNSVFFTFKNML